MYFPLFAGKSFAGAAIEAAEELLKLAQSRNLDTQALPIGVGVHTGIAYLGTVSGSEGSIQDITALGDSMNITARLASQANAGEALVSEATYVTAGLPIINLESRQLELKGKSVPVHVRVLRYGS